MADAPEPKWFRWLVLAALGLGVALIVVNFLQGVDAVNRGAALQPDGSCTSRTSRPAPAEAPAALAASDFSKHGPERSTTTGPARCRRWPAANYKANVLRRTTMPGPSSDGLSGCKKRGGDRLYKKRHVSVHLLSARPEPSARKWHLDAAIRGQVEDNRRSARHDRDQDVLVQPIARTGRARSGSRTSIARSATWSATVSSTSTTLRRMRAASRSPYSRSKRGLEPRCRPALRGSCTLRGQVGS